MQQLIAFVLVFGTVMIPVLWFFKKAILWAFILVTAAFGIFFIVRELRALRIIREIPNI